MILNFLVILNGIKSLFFSFNGGYCEIFNMKMVIYICNGSFGEKIFYVLVWDIMKGSKG